MEHLASLFFYDCTRMIFLLKDNSKKEVTFKPIRAIVESAENADSALIRILKGDFKFNLKNFHFFKKYIEDKRVEEVFTSQFPGFEALHLRNGAGMYSINYALELNIDDFYKRRVLKDLKEFFD